MRPNKAKLLGRVDWTLFGVLLFACCGRTLALDPTPTELLKIQAAQKLAGHLTRQDYDWDLDTLITRVDARAAKTASYDAIGIEQWMRQLDPQAFNTLDIDDNGVLNDHDTLEIYRLFLINFVQIQIDAGTQKLVTLNLDLDTTRTQLAQDSTVIPQTFSYSMVLLKETNAILARALVVGLDPLVANEVSTYLDRMRQKLNPNDPNGLQPLFQQVLDDYVNSPINRYLAIINFWQNRVQELENYMSFVRAASALPELVTLDANFPPRGDVPDVPVVTNFLSLGLWDRGTFQDGIINEGMDLILKVLQGKSSDDLVRILRPVDPNSQSQTRLSRLGLYSQIFKNLLTATNETINLNKIDEMASYGVQYVFNVPIPTVVDHTEDQKTRVKEFFTKFKASDMITDTSAHVIDDGTWQGMLDWKTQMLPKFGRLSYLNGIVDLYAGHEVQKEFLNHEMRSQIRTELKNIGFSESNIRFYYGGAETQFRALVNMGTWRSNTALGKWDYSVIKEGECDIDHINLNGGDGSTFLDPNARLKMFHDAALFNAYVSAAFPSGARRYLHFNVPVLEESIISPSDLSQRITETLVTLARMNVADVIMVRVASVASGGNSQDPEQTDPQTGKKIYLEAIKSARAILASSTNLPTVTVPPPVPDSPQNDPETDPLPTDFRNVFNPSHNENAEIGLNLLEAAHVRITLYDQMGVEISVLCDEDLPAGFHIKTWDGRNSAGSLVASGVYPAIINQDGQRKIQRILLVK